jgi:hypothetical protein
MALVSTVNMCEFPSSVVGTKSGLTQSYRNLFTSLPDDLIRLVCEYDTSYRRVFSTVEFRKELCRAYWMRESVQKQAEKEIYACLLRKQEYEEVFGNAFFELNLSSSNCYEDSDGEFRYVSTGRICQDIVKESFVHFSVFDDVLRYVVMPLSLKNAPVHIHYDELECVHSRMKYKYDGMCTFDCEPHQSMISLYTRSQLPDCPLFATEYYSQIGKIMPSIHMVSPSWIMEYHDGDGFDVLTWEYEFIQAGFTREDIAHMTPGLMAQMSKYMSTSRFVLWS